MSVAGGTKDLRDASAEPWNWRRYRQNRLALTGFQRALGVIREELETRRPRLLPADAELVAYRVLDRLTSIGGLDVVTLGMDADFDESQAERGRRKKRLPDGDP